MLNTKDMYDFLKDNYSEEGFREKLIKNFSFSVAGCRAYRKRNVLHFQQHPGELMGLMGVLQDKGIKSYMEMGISFCNTFCFMDSFFRTLSPDFEVSVGIDIEDKSDILKEYQTQYPTCSFVQTDVLKYEFTRDFDFIFIDTNQRYRYMKQTFEKCLPHARYIGFHDIAAHRWGALALFKELQEHYKFWSWSRSGAGIGLLEIK